MSKNEWNVAILGARMDNSVPEALCKSGLLKHLYTDLNRTKEFYTRSLFHKILGTKIPRQSTVSSKRVKSSLGIFILAKLIRKLDVKKTDLSRNLKSNTINKKFTKFCLKNGINNSKYIYAMKGAALEVFQENSKNVRVLEQSLITKKTEIDNINKLLQLIGRDDLALNFSDYRDIDKRNIEEIELSDFVVCPSRFVERDVLTRVPSAKTILIPYGVTNKNHKNVKIKHRELINKVLTVGEVGLRKGSPLIWRLAKEFSHIEFQMIGPVNLDDDFLRSKPDNIILRGVLSYEKVSEAYLESDLFLLPSVAEGSATVIYEAATHGLPVACSLQTGSVLENMTEAKVFDVFNFKEISDTIATMNDASTRKKYSQKALKKAALYTKEAYQANLVSHLKQI